MQPIRHHSKTAGFTLIELIAVIVMLGILAAVAMPKFADLSQAARIASLNEIQRNVSSGTRIVFARAAIEGKLSGTDTIEISGKTYPLEFGYPTAQAETLATLLDVPFLTFAPDRVCSVDWCIRGNALSIPSGISAGSGRIAKIYPRGKTWNEACGTYYINKRDGSAPEINIVSADC